MDQNKNVDRAQKRQRFHTSDSVSSDGDVPGLFDDGKNNPSLLDDDRFATEEDEDTGDEVDDDWALHQEILQSLMRAPSDPSPFQQELHDDLEHFINRHFEPSKADARPGSDWYPFRSWTHYQLTVWALVTHSSARSFRLLCGIIVDERFIKADVVFTTLQALLQCVDRLVPVATVHEVSSHTVVRRARKNPWMVVLSCISL